MLMFFSFAVLLGAVCFSESADYPRNPLCKQRNGYYAIEGNCDSYIECREYVANEMLCPDGLHYNPEAIWPTYACGYPMDVTCLGRSSLQPANPTSECPHQYGFYPSPQASPSNCGQYRMCVEGKAIEMLCPPGLAFNPENAQCDWPDLVSTCNAESFLGFTCLEDREHIDAVYNYPYPGNCYAFYSCNGDRARLLTCDAGYAFDASTSRCEDAERVVCEPAKS